MLECVVIQQSTVYKLNFLNFKAEKHNNWSFLNWLLCIAEAYRNLKLQYATLLHNRILSTISSVILYIWKPRSLSFLQVFKVNCSYHYYEQVVYCHKSKEWKIECL